MTTRTHSSRRRSRYSNRKRTHVAKLPQQEDGGKHAGEVTKNVSASGQRPSTGSLGNVARQRSHRSGNGEQQGEKPTSTKKKPGQKKRRVFRRELSSGGIIYRDREDQIEFFFIRDPYGRWTFPKGHQEIGETLIETAIREIDEETGLRGLRFVANLGKTRFRFTRGRAMIEKTVHLFLFEVSPKRKEKLPGTEGIHEAQWFPLEKAKKMSGYRNLDSLLSKAVFLAKKHKALV